MTREDLELSIFPCSVMITFAALKIFAMTIKVANMNKNSRKLVINSSSIMTF